jgi:hypothetical protein
MAVAVAVDPELPESVGVAVDDEPGVTVGTGVMVPLSSSAAASSLPSSVATSHSNDPGVLTATCWTSFFVME